MISAHKAAACGLCICAQLLNCIFIAQLEKKPLETCQKDVKMSQIHEN